jgi:hypothetical protein
MSDEMKSVLNTSVKIVNFIKSKPLQSRVFEKPCQEIRSIHKPFVLHTEVLWLSRGKVLLTRLLDHRDEVAILLDEKNDYAESLRYMLTYLADIFSKLN